LDHDRERFSFTILEAGGIDAFRSIGEDNEVFALEFFDNVFEEGIVEGFAPFLDANVHEIVDLLEAFAGHITDEFPSVHRIGFTRLEADDFFLRIGFEVGIFIEALFGSFVPLHEGFEIGGFVAFENRGAGLFHVGDEHTKLGAPIAEVVEAKYILFEEFKEASQAVTDNGGADVTDVQFLGDVRRGELDDDFLSFYWRSRAEKWIFELAVELG
jgi:hypothetical protein